MYVTHSYTLTLLEDIMKKKIKIKIINHLISILSSHNKLSEFHNLFSSLISMSIRSLAQQNVTYLFCFCLLILLFAFLFNYSAPRLELWVCNVCKYHGTKKKIDKLKELKNKLIRLYWDSSAQQN